MVQITGRIETVFDIRHHSGTAAYGALKPGDRLTARVLRTEPDQRVLMDFGHFRALAHMDQSVTCGEVIHLKVTDTGPPVLMRIVRADQTSERPQMPLINPAQVLSREDRQRLDQLVGRMLASKAITGAPQDPGGLRRALSGLRDLMAPLSLEKSSREIAAQLKTKIEDSGLFFEKKLAQWLLNDAKGAHGSKLLNEKEAALSHGDSHREKPVASPVSVASEGRPLERLLITLDMKAHLLVLKSFAEQLDPSGARSYGLTGKQIQFFQHAVSILLEHVQQEQDHLAQRGPQSQLSQLSEIMTHWVPVAGQEQSLKLKWYYPVRQGLQDSDRPQQVCLLLDMDQLGPVRADLKLLGRGLQLTFSVTTLEVQHVFEGALEELNAILEAFFSSIDSRVEVSAEKITRFDSPETVLTESGKIDIQA